MKYRLKAITFYLVISILFILAPFCLFGAFNAASLYTDQIDMGHFAVNINDKLNETQKKKEHKELDNYGFKIKIDQFLFGSATFILPLLAIGLISYRKDILQIKKTN